MQKVTELRKQHPKGVFKIKKGKVVEEIVEWGRSYKIESGRIVEETEGWGQAYLVEI